MYRLTHNVFMKKYKLLLVAALLLGSMHSYSQNVSSPYSIIGIGDIESSYFNRTSGMANTGIAYQNDKQITLNNPASLSGLQNQLFLVDLYGRGKFVTFSGKTLPTNLTGKDFSVERLSLGMRITKWWGSAIGLMPFSTSNYSFSGTKNLQGTSSTLPVEYDGSGGVNRFFFANGFKITKNLSIGINTSFLGGSLTEKDSLISPDLSTALFTTKNTYIRDWYFEYGLQYHIPVSKKWDVTIGATYAPKTALRDQNSALVLDETGDTLSNRVISNTVFTLPNTTGVGIAVSKNKQLTFVADYRFQDWKSLNIKGQNYALVNSNRYSVGAEYAKQKVYVGVPYETFSLQAGFFYDQSYLKIYNEQINDVGFTLGAGLNSKRSTLSYHLSFEYGVRGSNNTPIKENYAGFTFGLSFKDFWYTKGRRYE
jgi:hypothetical protein